MSRGFTDIHHHLLWGMDDGARSAEEMLAMLRRASGEGIARIIATPHVTPGIKPFDRQRFDRALSEARALCEEERLNVEIFAGAEILYTHQTCRFLRDGRVPTLADTEYVLVEFSPDIPYARLCGALAELLQSGYLPIIAHVERYDCLLRRPSRLLKLRRELDIRCQVNCGTIIRRKGFFVRRFLKKIMDWNLLDAIATDAHHASPPRAANMREAWNILRREIGEVRADELTNGHLLFEAAGGGKGEEDA